MAQNIGGSHVEGGSRVSQVNLNAISERLLRDRPRSEVSGTSSPLRAANTPSEHRFIDLNHNGHTASGTPSNMMSPPVQGRHFHPDASIVLVGIRASGKRSLGLIAATALGRRFITEDHYFQTLNGLSRHDYLKVHGSEQFHRQDVETSRRMLEDNRHKCVIECGLGSLTGSLQDYLRQYCQTNPVIFVLRDMDHIKTLLSLDDRSAKLLENGNYTHRKCSNFEYYNLEDESTDAFFDTDIPDRTSPNYSFKLKNTQADFSWFVRSISGSTSSPSNMVSPFSMEVPVERRTYTHALLVRLSDFVAGRIDFSALESAGDVLEIVVDEWLQSSPNALSKMVAIARRALKLPILLSVSNANFLSSHNESYLAVLRHGLRLGIEYVSVDLDLDEHKLAQLIAGKGHTKLVGNHIEISPNANGWRDSKWHLLYKRALSSRVDVVRFLSVPASRHANQTLTWFLEELNDLYEAQPVVSAFNLGPLGRTSQMMNSVLTTVTHPALSQAQTTGQDHLRPVLSSRDIVAALFDSYVFDSLDFYIVGANVSGSLSPPMHNAAYACLGLRHHYSTMNIKSWSDVKALANKDTLGGLSIVQPYKVKIVPDIGALSVHARAIGAVNTVVPLRANVAGVVPPLQIQAQERNRAGRIMGWFGENTDYIGIMTCVNRSLSPRNVVQPRSTALVIGAGGMARAAVYAMLQLGCKNIFVYNRTIAHTRAIVAHFNEWARSQTNGQGPAFAQDPVRVIDSLADPWPSSFSLATVVVSCVTHELLDGNPGADFELPDSWIQSPTGGVVVEMAYMTKETPLIKQMKEYRKMTNTPWVLVDGIETLIEQAVTQFETMTGRKAPKRCMADAVNNSLRQNFSYMIDGEECFS
ncbi:hypothetical protein H2202_009994 [Exophiala xenobiotica]|nr:hypothetical protein H2202_009994 [Exophiala xenobiotica]KAK5225189.1 hypothetical protein LTR47_009614 [Exophiala xenobiotica]KAK5247142.1 hypothetical protein LTS06_007679 [Exophiala xenobiotica]KAK5282357.1 hypothetical protein LTR40_003426 [Exophiala xenobiotica]KAK5315545.1 hypothetical protein LTR93_009800 [Exophiala xenobiotica]